MAVINSRQTGKRYEDVALSYLKNAGLKHITSNVTYPIGEIDLIMQDGNVWVFVEVRFRRSAQFGGAVFSVTPRKQQRILQAALCWFMANNRSVEQECCRFDIFAITGNQVEWIKNAFDSNPFC